MISADRGKRWAAAALLVLATVASLRAAILFDRCVDAGDLDRWRLECTARGSGERLMGPDSLGLLLLGFVLPLAAAIHVASRPNRTFAEGGVGKGLWIALQFGAMGLFLCGLGIAAPLAWFLFFASRRGCCRDPAR